MSLQNGPPLSSMQWSVSAYPVSRHRRDPRGMGRRKTRKGVRREVGVGAPLRRRREVWGGRLGNRGGRGLHVPYTAAKARN